MTIGFWIVVLGVVLLLRSLGVLEGVSDDTFGALSVIAVGLWLMYMRFPWSRRRRWRVLPERRERRDARDRGAAV